MAVTLENADLALLAAIREGLAERGDPAKAPGMQAYMRSAMPYQGVQMAGQKALAREVFKAHPLPDEPSWRDTTLELWRGAEYREERYLAIALTGYRAYAAYQTPAALPLYEELIVTGAWWDYVDEVAIRRVGPILRTHPRVVRPLMLAWSRDADLWRRRTAIICQVKAKRETDLDLLTACVEPNLGDRDFFIRKAIGWALRDYAWTDPEWVRRWVAAHDERLAGLSRREALKNVGQAPDTTKPPPVEGGGFVPA
jgi:3-methyladenine DNA glycosylase AlkD